METKENIKVETISLVYICLHVKAMFQINGETIISAYTHIMYVLIITTLELGWLSSFSHHLCCVH